MNDYQLLLLPGMDGTGRLFKAFLEQLGDFIDYRVVSYPVRGLQNYARLTEYTQSLLQTDKSYILLAESFSGPIAFNLARQQENIKGIIFAAAFLQNPRPFISRFRKLIPWQTLLYRQFPTWFIKTCLLGQASNKELIAEFYTSIQKAGLDTLKQRLDNISQLKLPASSLHKPCVYLQASNDYLVPATVLSGIQRICHQLTIHRVPGTHFVLQSSPDSCSKIIKDEFKNMCMN